MSIQQSYAELHAVYLARLRELWPHLSPATIAVYLTWETIEYHERLGDMLRYLRGEPMLGPVPRPTWPLGGER